MRLVRVSEHSTITAYRLFTRVAVVGEWCLVLCAHLFPSGSRTFPGLLNSLNCFGNVRQETCIHQLVWPQHAPTMRTLLASFLYPFTQTTTAGEFRARWTHDRILNCAKADETREDLLEVDTFFSWLVTRGDLLLGARRANTVGRVTWSSRWDRWNAEVIIRGIDLHCSALPSLHLRSLPLFSLSAFSCFTRVSPWCHTWFWLLFILLNLIQKVIDLHFFGCWNRLHQWHMIRSIILRGVVKCTWGVVHDIHLTGVAI